MASKIDGMYKIRHSAAHVMAQAVLELYPEAKFAIGPPIENGFYYDFDLGVDQDGAPRTFRPEDLKTIEKRMRQIIGGKHRFDYREVSAEEARRLFADQPYKLELIDGLAEGEIDEYGSEAERQGRGARGEGREEQLLTPDPTPLTPKISTYKHDTFEDLCRGPHVEHTGQIVADGFQLLSVAGAYWRGDEKNPMLQRIYGTAWRNRKELRKHLDQIEEAKKRDHRKLGRELEIFIFEEEVGPGLPLWLPRGAIIIEELERLAKETEEAAGYDRVRTPHLTKEDLFLRSGHLAFYKDSMYPPMEMEGVTYYVKPMNCPMHHKIFGSKLRSYRELPVRLAEYGTCYRYEQSGELFGLMRVRSMQMNDAHIYCTQEQFAEEFMRVVDLYKYYFDLFEIERFVMRLSTHHPKKLGEKYVDNRTLWEQTEEMVRQAMTEGNVPFEEEPDEAAFYGPKIDVQIWSAIGREFTLATNQVDFAQPERLDLSYVNAAGEQEIPLCIHRAPLSTHERMIGFLIEHYGGNFPVWLSPEQVRVIPVTSAHNEYAAQIEKRLADAGARVSADLGSDRMNNKIRQAQGMKVPYMLIVGDREVEEETVSLRRRDGVRQNGMPAGEFASLVAERIASRASEL